MLGSGGWDCEQNEFSPLIFDMFLQSKNDSLSNLFSRSSWSFWRAMELLSRAFKLKSEGHCHRHSFGPPICSEYWPTSGVRGFSSVEASVWPSQSELSVDAGGASSSVMTGALSSMGSYFWVDVLWGRAAHFLLICTVSPAVLGLRVACGSSYPVSFLHFGSSILPLTFWIPFYSCNKFLFYLN